MGPRAGWLAHGLAIVLDTSGIGTPQVGARFGFAPALSVTLWLVLAVYAIESRFVPLPGVRRSLALLGHHRGEPGLVLSRRHETAPGVAVAAGALDPRHRLLWPVRRGRASCGAADQRGTRDARAAQRHQPAPLGLPLLRLEKLTFRFVAAGFVVLSAALLLGWWFASPWRWDHKAVFSVLAWAVFAGLLAGRRVFGWRGRMATRWLYTGAALLLLGYVGSRFVLEVVLERAVMSSHARRREARMKYLLILLRDPGRGVVPARLRAGTWPPRFEAPQQQGARPADGRVRPLRRAPAGQRGGDGQRRARLLQRGSSPGRTGVKPHSLICHSANGRLP